MRKRATSAASSQTTCYVIAYDIPDDHRRTKVHKILLGFGKWTQYSLFECFLTRKQLVLLRSKLAEYLEAKQDSVRFYPLCAGCLSKVETVGLILTLSELACFSAKGVIRKGITTIRGKSGSLS